MHNHFAFIDESGILDGGSREQPYFAVGLLKISDTAEISEKLTQRHYDYFSIQKVKRKQLVNELGEKPRTLSQHELNLLLSSTRHI